MPTSTTPGKTTATPKRPAKAKAKKGVSSASDFKKAKSQELELPSGNVALVKRPGMEKLIAKGIFSDSLLPVVQEQLDKAKTGKKSSDLDMGALLKDPQKILDIMDTYDRAIALTVTQPKVVWHKQLVVDDDGKPVLDKGGKEQFEEIPEDERDEELVYTDDVDLTDKMFIFQYVVGGSPDLATFRQEFGASVAALPDGEDV